MHALELLAVVKFTFCRAWLCGGYKDDKFLHTLMPVFHSAVIEFTWNEFVYTIAVLFYILIIFWTWKSLNFAYFWLSLELVRSYVVTFNFKHGNFVIFLHFWNWWGLILKEIFNFLQLVINENFVHFFVF